MKHSMSHYWFAVVAYYYRTEANDRQQHNMFPKLSYLDSTLNQPQPLSIEYIQWVMAKTTYSYHHIQLSPHTAITTHSYHHTQLSPHTAITTYSYHHIQLSWLWQLVEGKLLVYIIKLPPVCMCVCVCVCVYTCRGIIVGCFLVVRKTPHEM